jgi:mono/diheme cytochrome c family protein
MRKSVFLISITVALAAMAVAQIGDDEYKKEMQSLGANVTAVRDAADAAAAAPAAKNLSETFTKVAAYWKAKNAPDAVMFAENARDAAKAIEDGKGDKAANLMKLQQQCGACHMAHRGGGRGNFTIK